MACMRAMSKKVEYIKLLPSDILGSILGQIPNKDVLNFAMVNEATKNKVLTRTCIGQFDKPRGFWRHFLLHEALDMETKPDPEFLIRLIYATDIQKRLAPNAGGHIPLSIALSRGHTPEVVKALVQAAPEAIYIKVRIVQGCLYPVSIAIENKYDMDIIKMLYPGEKFVSSEVLLQKARENGYSPLCFESIRTLSAGNKPVPNVRLHKTLDAYKRDSEQDPEFIIRLIHTIGMKVLLAPDNRGLIPLHIALHRRHPREVVHALVRAAPNAIYIRAKFANTSLYPVSMALHMDYDIDTIRLLFPGDNYEIPGDLMHRAISKINYSIPMIECIRTLSTGNMHFVASAQACYLCLQYEAQRIILLELAQHVELEYLASVLIHAINRSMTMDLISDLFDINPKCVSYPYDMRKGLPVIYMSDVVRLDPLYRAWYVLQYMLVWVNHNMDTTSELHFVFDDDLLIRVYQAYPEVASKTATGVINMFRNHIPFEQTYHKTTTLALALGRNRYYDTRLVELLFWQHPEAVNEGTCTHGRPQSEVHMYVIVEMIKHRLNLKIIQHAIEVFRRENPFVLCLYYALQQINYVDVIEFFVDQLSHETYKDLKDTFLHEYSRHPHDDVCFRTIQKTPLLQLLSLPNNNANAIMKIMALDGLEVYQNDNGYASIVLNQVLKHRKYTEIVKFILDVNPNIAMIETAEHPLPLYQALTTHCEDDVVDYIYRVFMRQVQLMHNTSSTAYDFSRLEAIPKFRELRRNSCNLTLL